MCIWYVPLLPRESKQTRSVIGVVFITKLELLASEDRGRTSIITNMSAPGEATLPATRRVRKSIGVHTELSRKDNATMDVGGSLAGRKSRSKSIGPGAGCAQTRKWQQARGMNASAMDSQSTPNHLYSLSLRRPNSLARF